MTLKNAIVQVALSEHHWDPKALDYLRVIQLSAIADQIIPDKRAWEQTCEFMAKAASDRLHELNKVLDGMLLFFSVLMVLIVAAKGPSTLSSWLTWRSPTIDQQINQSLQNELRTMLLTNPVHFI